MKKKFNHLDAYKQELNCGYIILPIIHYFEQLFGKETAKGYIESLGVPLKYFNKRSNWVSYDYFIALLEKLVEVTGDKRAPYNASFSVNPKATFNEFLYMTYATYLSRSLKDGYKFAFNKNTQSRYSKIGYFEIIEETKNSITVKSVLRDGYKQNKLNCLSVEGILASGPLAWGLKPAEIVHEKCAANGEPYCIYHIKWEENKKPAGIILLIIFGVSTLFELFLLFKNILSVKDIVISSLSFAIIYIVKLYFKIYKEKKDEEIVNHNKNKFIVEAMEKTESDYREILQIKKETENILASIPAGVIIFEKHSYQIKYVNKFLLSNILFLKDKTTADIIGQQLFSIFPFDDNILMNIKNCLISKKNKRMSDLYEINFGSRIYEYNLFDIIDINDNKIMIGMILNDITDTKNFEQKLLLNEKLLALGKVASGIAHEINNPLYAILADAETISEDENISEENRTSANEIIELVLNISNVIKDLSAYSKTLRNEKMDSINLHTVINESINLVRYGLNFLVVTIVKEFSKIPNVIATKGEMQQIFINIINNAVQSLENRPGTLTIKTNYDDNKKIIIVEITDTGYGIDEKDMPNIFELFYTTKEDKGTGQGLHIVKTILTKYNGNIEINSKKGAGTTVIIYFTNLEVEE